MPGGGGRTESTRMLSTFFAAKRVGWLGRRIGDGRYGCDSVVAPLVHQPAARWHARRKPV